MHSQPKEIIDEYKMTVGDMRIELYKVPPFLLAEILSEFMIEATIRKNTKSSRRTTLNPEGEIAGLLWQ